MMSEERMMNMIRLEIWGKNQEDSQVGWRAAGVCPDLADDEEGAYDIKDRSSFRIDAIVQNEY